MSLLNLGGLLGLGSSLAVVAVVCAAVGWDPLHSDAHGLHALHLAAFLASIFGLSWDRCERRGLLASYRLLLETNYSRLLGQEVADTHPGRRLAVAGVPLALTPVLVLVAGGLFFAVDRLTALGAFSGEDWEGFFLAAALSIAASLAYAGCTGGLRLVEAGEPEVVAPRRPAPRPAIRPPQPAPTSERVGMMPELRSAVGSPPRGLDLRPGDRLERPTWTEPAPDDPYEVVFTDEDLVLARGQLVWGHVVEADPGLLEPGYEVLAARVVYGLDESFDLRVDLLRDVAGAVLELRGTQPSDRAVARLADLLTNEYLVVFNHPVPSALWNGPTLHYTSLLVSPLLLPDDYLVSLWLPLLVLPGKTDASLVLPVRFWTDEVKRTWQGGRLPVRSRGDGARRV